jgi:DNA-binding transcriptional MerR regulator
MSPPAPIANTYLRIGQIAERSGVSAKALRLYEQRGLLKPCTHSQAGYRLYGPDALRRLMQIVLLKRSGFTLAQIMALLSSTTPMIADVLGARIDALERDVADKARALQSLRAVAERVGSASTLDLDQLLESITMTNSLDMHLADARRNEILERADAFGALQSPAEAARVRTRVEERLDELGPDGIEAAQRPWRELSADIRAAMSAGLAATDDVVSALAHRWQAQVSTFVAADPDFLSKLRDAYTRHPQLMTAQSMSPPMMDYMDAAMAAAGLLRLETAQP